MSVENAAWHNHRTTVVEGHNVCMDCGEIVIKPILDINDPRLTAENTTLKQGMDIVVLQALTAMLKTQGIDIVLIELANRRAAPWPDYVDQLANKYDASPPHVELLYNEQGNLK